MFSFDDVIMCTCVYDGVPRIQHGIQGRVGCVADLQVTIQGALAHSDNWC